MDVVDLRVVDLRDGGWSMSNEREWPDADTRRIRGSPRSKVPEEPPPRKKPHVENVPDTGPPDTDNEGHMAPPAE